MIKSLDDFYQEEDFPVVEVIHWKWFFKKQSFTYDGMKTLCNACCTNHDKNYYEENHELKLFQQKKKIWKSRKKAAIIKSMLKAAKNRCYFFYFIKQDFGSIAPSNLM